MSEVVWSVNIMVGILLIAVGYVIYWVFKYDEWYPNNITSNISSEHRSHDSGDEGMAE
tara:strand:- start:178 stop:351 length:174 start_codon:yes stop_codon:yes gene_type:complete